MSRLRLGRIGATPEAQSKTRLSCFSFEQGGSRSCSQIEQSAFSRPSMTHEKAQSVEEIVTIGIEIAKLVLQVHTIYATGMVVVDGN